MKLACGNFIQFWDGVVSRVNHQYSNGIHVLPSVLKSGQRMERAAANMG